MDRQIIRFRSSTSLANTEILSLSGLFLHSKDSISAIRAIGMIKKRCHWNDRSSPGIYAFSVKKTPHAGIASPLSASLRSLGGNLSLMKWFT